MNQIFLNVINISISTTWLILVVFVLRLILKKFPKWMHVLLWGIVAIRFICPFSIKSPFSFIPSTETIPLNIEMNTTPTIHSGINAIDHIVNPLISQSNTPINNTSVNPLQVTIAFWGNIWILGIIVLSLYICISYWRLYHMVNTAILYKDNIFQSDVVSFPFVLGVIKPKVYLPFQLEQQNLEYVIAHEQAHIYRKDYLWKLIGFLILTIHWFNPFVWIAYIFLCRDIEFACDEMVIKRLNNEQKAHYTQALVNCSLNHSKRTHFCSLAFGKVSVTERVKAVMNYKKTTFIISILSIVICIIIAICFLTNPLANVNNNESTNVSKFAELYAPNGEIDIEYEVTTKLSEFPYVTFHYNSYQIIASNDLDSTEEILIWGMPIWNAYFYDINGDKNEHKTI